MPFTDLCDNVISVSALNLLIRNLIESRQPVSWVGGELSNLTLAASGHAYFSLKDNNAQVRCVMFRQRLAALPFRLVNGMQVELRGQASLYEARGEFQINVETIREAGLGRLFEAFEKLKCRLAAEGLFAEERKRSIPTMPNVIGIITSPAGAALQDVVTTIKRRMPAIQLIVYPTLVQGEAAAAQIANAIRTADSRQETDTLIVCRGGGSIEDLWPFNEEIVARAIHACSIPVISGVGHETDFTICDFVADLRAATPTAAAELAVPARQQLLAKQQQIRQHLQRAIRRQLENKAQKIDLRAQQLRHPGERLQQIQQLLCFQQHRLTQLGKQALQKKTLQLQSTGERLLRQRPALALPGEMLNQRENALLTAIRQQLLHRRQLLAQHAAVLSSCNPHTVLARGYAIVSTADGQIIRTAQAVQHGQHIHIRLADGQTEALIHDPHTAQGTLPF